MSALGRTLLSVVVVAGCCLAAMTWCFWSMSDASAAAIRASSDAVAAERLAMGIASLRGQPRLAGDATLDATELSRRIEQAATEADIEPENLVRVAPGTPTRLDNTAYQERPVQVQFKDLTLTELVTFLSAISSDGAGLQARSLRLSAPRQPAQEADDGLWSVEVTLSYLVYSPASGNTPRPADPSSF